MITASCGVDGVAETGTGNRRILESAYDERTRTNTSWPAVLNSSRSGTPGKVTLAWVRLYVLRWGIAYSLEV